MTSGKLNSKRFYICASSAIVSIVALSAIMLFFMSPTSITSTLLHKNLHSLPTLEVGDIIFREGIGVESIIIQKLSKHNYTHIGLVISTKPIIILHATPDDNPKKPNQVILSSFSRTRSISQLNAFLLVQLHESKSPHNQYFGLANHLCFIQIQMRYIALHCLSGFYHPLLH